jgi:hypothetical protein
MQHRVKIIEMLEAVVQDDRCESVIREGESRCIGLNKPCETAETAMQFSVNSHNVRSRSVFRKTALGAPKVKDKRASPQMCQDLMHTRVAPFTRTFLG